MTGKPPKLGGAAGKGAEAKSETPRLVLCRKLGVKTDRVRAGLGVGFLWREPGKGERQKGETLENHGQRAVVAHTFNPTNGGAEASGSLMEGLSLLISRPDLLYEGYVCRDLVSKKQKQTKPHQRRLPQPPCLRVYESMWNVCLCSCVCVCARTGSYYISSAGLELRGPHASLPPTYSWDRVFYRDLRHTNEV